MPLPRIDSPKNPKIVATAKLLDRKTRQRAGMFLVEGWRAVKTALEAEAPIEEVYATRDALERPGAGLVVASLTASNVAVYEASDTAIRRLCDTVTPQGIVAVARRIDRRFEDLRLGKRPLVLVADAVSDPGNFGSLVRLAGASRADALVAVGSCCDWTSPKVLRASAGSVFHVPIVRAPVEAFGKFLERRRLALAVTVGAGGEPIYDADLTGGLALAFGNEAFGVSPELLERSDMRLTIPMPGQADSLNVTAAAAVAVFESLRQRGTGIRAVR